MTVKAPVHASRRCRSADRPPQEHDSAWRSSGGFTMLEIALVLFLMVGMLSLVIPRMSIGDNLGSVGRKWVGAMKSFQELAMMGQKTVRLYVDIDRGMYWPMVRKSPAPTCDPARLPWSISSSSITQR